MNMLVSKLILTSVKIFHLFSSISYLQHMNRHKCIEPEQIDKLHDEVRTFMILLAIMLGLGDRYTLLPSCKREHGFDGIALAARHFTITLFERPEGQFLMGLSIQHNNGSEPDLYAIQNAESCRKDGSFTLSELRGVDTYKSIKRRVWLATAQNILLGIKNHSFAR